MHYFVCVCMNVCVYDYLNICDLKIKRALMTIMFLLKIYDECFPFVPTQYTSVKRCSLSAPDVQVFNRDQQSLNSNLDPKIGEQLVLQLCSICLLYTSPSPRDRTRSRMPSSA